VNDRPPIQCAKRGLALYPCSDFDAEIVRALSPTLPVFLHPSQARHPGQHRLYWSLLTLVGQNTEPAVTADELHAWVKPRCGVEITDQLTGEVTELAPSSIAFDAMEQPEFQTFLQRVIDLLTTRIIPGLDRADLTREASAMLGYAA